MKAKYHLDVAKEAFAPFLKPRALDWILRGNFNTDFYGTLGWKFLEWKLFPLYPVARHWYHPIDHLDMCPNMQKLIDSWNELRRRLREVADDAKYPPSRIKKMFIALGRATHALTDVYGHSIYVELLYDYYRNNPDAAAEVAASGLPLPEFIGKHAPTFGDIADGAAEKYRVFIKDYIEPNIFSDECLPDKGPRSHAEINKDSPESKVCQDPRYPGIFDQSMILANKDVKRIVREFFDNLKAGNPAKFRLLTEAMPDEMPAPGPFERRAIFWSTKFGAYD